MNAGEVVVIVIGVVSVAAFLVWVVMRRKDPEGAASHDADPARVGSARFHGPVNDRPAGPALRQTA